MPREDVHAHWPFIAAALPFAVAAMLVGIVIPLAATDTFRGANPRGSSIAFGVVAVVHLLLGTFALRSKRSSGTVPLWLGVLALILGLVLLDPAFAFMAHPGLLLAVVAVFLCAFADFGAAAVVFVTAFLRSRAMSKPVGSFK